MYKYGEILRAKRKAEKKTQEEYALLLGMRRENYCRLEKGELDIKQTQILKICEQLDMSADELLGRRKP